MPHRTEVLQLLEDLPPEIRSGLQELHQEDGALFGDSPRGLATWWSSIAVVSRAARELGMELEPGDARALVMVHAAELREAVEDVWTLEEAQRWLGDRVAGDRLRS